MNSHWYSSERQLFFWNYSSKKFQSLSFPSLKTICQNNKYYCKSPPADGVINENRLDAEQLAARVDESSTLRHQSRVLTLAPGPWAVIYKQLQGWKWKYWKSNNSTDPAAATAAVQRGSHQEAQIRGAPDGKEKQPRMRALYRSHKEEIGHSVQCLWLVQPRVRLLGRACLGFVAKWLMQSPRKVVIMRERYFPPLGARSRWPFTERSLILLSGTVEFDVYWSFKEVWLNYQQ